MHWSYIFFNVDVLPENIGPRINSKYPSLFTFAFTLLDADADADADADDEAFIFKLCMVDVAINEQVFDKSVLFIYI
jgi:hypothetical protein